MPLLRYVSARGRYADVLWRGIRFEGKGPLRFGLPRGPSSESAELPDPLQEPRNLQEFVARSVLPSHIKARAHTYELRVDLLALLSGQLDSGDRLEGACISESCAREVFRF